MAENVRCNHENCNIANPNQSVCQTLSELDWERSLWNAAFSGDIERVQTLIDKSGDAKYAVNALDRSGYAPLHYAARSGKVEICQILLQNGACIDAQTRCGKATPLHKAAAAGRVKAIIFLIESGANIEMKDADGKTAFHKLVENKHFYLIDTLLEACPSLKDLKDIRGNHAMRLAILRLHRILVMMKLRDVLTYPFGKSTYIDYEEKNYFFATMEEDCTSAASKIRIADAKS